MKPIKISDITLREFDGIKDYTLSFKERLEVAKMLDKLKVDTIELPEIKNDKTDVLTNKTISSVVTFSNICAMVGFDEEKVEMTWESIKNAKKPALQVSLPCSPIQMEYFCQKKAPKMLDMIKALVSKCRFYSENVEFCAMDATRAENSFLFDAIKIAIENGANRITICDEAGAMLPIEFSEFIDSIYENVPEIKNVQVGVQVSNEFKMAQSNYASVITKVDYFKTASCNSAFCDIESFCHFVNAKANDLKISSSIKTTEASRIASQLEWILKTQKSESSPFDNGVSSESSGVTLDENDDIAQVNKVVAQLGYDLSEDDNAKVYEAFKRVAVKKHFVGAKELEAIIASSALQVPTTYHIENYVINSGNIITATANITLSKDGKNYSGISAGDGPIDAAFLAVEQIVGHHYELDDFQIQSVTEGREAMGSAIVKLRSNGKLFSGRGISTDVIGASIRAYINALNKIVYEEA